MMIAQIPWPDWLFRKVPDAEVAVGLFLTAGIVLVWAIVTISGARQRRKEHPGSRYGFDFWLGVYLIVGDASLYILLAWSIMTDQEDTDFWIAAWFLLIFFSAALAFWAWGRERREPPR